MGWEIISTLSAVKEKRGRRTVYIKSICDRD
jgi:hypothetical protein